jgi:hypothetical protein
MTWLSKEHKCEENEQKGRVQILLSESDLVLDMYGNDLRTSGLKFCPFCGKSKKTIEHELVNNEWRKTY